MSLSYGSLVFILWPYMLLLIGLIISSFRSEGRNYGIFGSRRSMLKQEGYSSIDC